MTEEQINDYLRYSEAVKTALIPGYDVVDAGSDTVDAGPELITFTIDDIPYQAEEGMTWAEWAESDYNTGEFYASTVDGWNALTDGNGNYIC